MNRPPLRRDWITKTLAGLLLGFTLALVSSGLFAQLSPQLPLSIRAQLSMWMVFPVWLCVLSGVYFFGSGLRAWLWLSGATLGLGTLLLVIR